MSFSHPSQGAQVFAAMVVIAIVLLWLSLRIRRRERLVRDLPTSKVQGVFIGLVELSVTAESEKPLTSYLGGRLSVHYSYRVDEHWRRTVSEAYTDDKGQPQTRTRVEEGWKTIAAGGAAEPFYGRDETGVILIRPEGAKFEGVGFFDRTVTKGDPLYATKATPIAASPRRVSPCTPRFSSSARRASGTTWWRPRSQPARQLRCSSSRPVRKRGSR